MASGMALIGPDDQNQLRADFATMTRRVHLLFFTQALECATCLQTRQILDELPALSDKIFIDEVNFVLEADRARQYGIDRVPAIAVAYEDGGSSEETQIPGQTTTTAEPVLQDSRIRFLGMPGGYEFISLVQAIRLARGTSIAAVGCVAASVSPRSTSRSPCTCSRRRPVRTVLAPSRWPMRWRLRARTCAAFAVEATEYPDLARRYRVTGVPKTVVDDDVEILGALPEEDFVNQALGKFMIER